MGEQRSHITGRAAKNTQKFKVVPGASPSSGIPGWLVTVIGGGVPPPRACNGGEDGGVLKGGFEGRGCRSGMRSPFPPSTSWALHLGGVPLGVPPPPPSRNVSFLPLHLGTNRKLQSKHPTSAQSPVGAESTCRLRAPLSAFPHIGPRVSGVSGPRNPRAGYAALTGRHLPVRSPAAPGPDPWLLLGEREPHWPPRASHRPPAAAL